MSYLLIVEPSRLMARLIADASGAAPEQLRTVSNVADAIAHIGRERPLLIVTSHELPSLSGISLIACLKSDPHYRAIPIALLTSSTQNLETARYQPDCVLAKNPDLPHRFAEFAERIGARQRWCPADDQPTATPLSGRILLAEDTTMIQRLVGHMLHVAGAEVVAVDNGQLALERALAEPFDLILMDVEMPVMDGPAATATLRSRGVQTPIIAFTAHDREEYRPQAHEAGFDDVLTKPVTKRALIETCRDLLTAAPAG